jgi:hypothetical protein
MDAKVIERLLVDRHLGELPNDVSELLDAYIVDKPEYSRLQRDITKVLTLAGQALEPPMPDETPMPSLSSAASTGAAPIRLRRSVRTWGRTAALAAALAISFILGNRTSGPTHGPLVGPEIVVRAGGGHADEPGAGFWSLSRLRESASHGQHAGTTNRINWTAPFSPTWTGERT